MTMSKGLGKLQICILKAIKWAEKNPMYPPSVHVIYQISEENYWGECIIGENFQWHQVYIQTFDSDEDKIAMNRRRASISQALSSLYRKELVAKYNGFLSLTAEGRKVLSDLMLKEKQ